MHEWQPITAAPTDGTRVRLRRVYQRRVIADGCGYFGSVVIGYQPEDGGPQRFDAVWVDEDGDHFFPTPTHWKPTPPSEPPA